jgi:regulator of protease activity HflC (stomatin/prohibitin superfamily)
MTAGVDKLVAVLIGCIRVFQFWTVIDHYERGVLLRFGKFTRLLEPGLHWVFPMYIDKPLSDNVVTRTKDLPQQILVTQDQRTVAVTAVVTCHIIDIKKSLLEVESVDDALVDTCSACVGRHVTTNPWATLHGDDEVRLTRAARNHARAYGIEIERVQLVTLAPARVLSLHGAPRI